MRILVTGGTGFVGSNLTKRLLSDGHEVIITGCRTEQTPPPVKVLEPGLSGIDWCHVKNIDVLYHQSANNDTLCEDRDEMMLANVHGPQVLFQRCLDAGCGRFVFASSTAVYGSSPAPYIEGSTPVRPLNVYGESKAVFEDFAMDFGARHGVNVVGLRYCNVYGPGESHKGRRASMIHQLVNTMARGVRPRLFPHGEQRRDYIHADDVAQANIAASLYSGTGIFNCGSGSSASFLEITQWINEYLGLQLEPEWIENPKPESYQTFTQTDMKKAKEELLFRPSISIKEGVLRFTSAFVTR